VKITISMFGVAALFSSLMLADSSKISPDLLAQGPFEKANVIVLYKTPPGQSQGALPNIPLLSGLLRGPLTQVFSNVNAISLINVPLLSIEILSNDPNVTYITPDRPLTQLLDYSSAAVNGGAAISAGLTGLGIGVAVIDSGVANSPDLANFGILTRVVYRQNFATEGSTDQFGHGTHVAGIIGANGTESSCRNCTRLLKGIAPNASIVDLRVLDDTGAGTDSGVIAAIDRAIQLKTAYNIRVINLSLGRPIQETYKNDPLCQAVEAAWKAGIVVVVAAGNNGRDNSVGNDGYGTIQSPANDPYVITVGAMKAMGTYSRTDDLIASYSSKGPSGIDFVVKPDLVAPGNHLVSLEAPKSVLARDPATAVPLSYYMATMDQTTSTTFMMLNGTSMATPVVSGAVADLLQGQPSLTPDQVKARLMATAYKQFPKSSTAVDQVTGQIFTSEYDVFTIGAGYLDIAAALANHHLATGTAMSPLASYNSSDASVYMVFDPSSTWGRPGSLKGPWASRAVWGSTVVGPDLAISGSQAVWGSSAVGGFQAVWGSQGVWGAESSQGSSTPQGTRAVWGADSQTSDSDTTFTVNP
jgi:serine protease AprX